MAEDEKSPYDLLNREIKRTWRRGDLKQCLVLVEQLPPPKGKGAISLLRAILTDKHAPDKEEEAQEIRHAIKLHVLRLAGRVDSASACYLLIDVLGNSESEISDESAELLRQKGGKALRFLRRRLHTQNSLSLLQENWELLTAYRMLQVIGDMRLPEAAPDLINTLKKETFGSRKYLTILSGLIALLVIVGGAAFVSSYSFWVILLGGFLWAYLSEVIASLLEPFPFPVLSAINKGERAMLQAVALRGLQGIADTRHINELLLCYQESNLLSVEQGEATLQIYLNFLTAESADSLEFSVQRWLAKQVPNVTESLAMSMLQVLGWCGGAEILPILKRTTNRTASVILRAKIQEVLPMIERRAASERSSTHLLRASQEPTQSQNLLRPASSQQDPQERLQLLRAHQMEEEEE
jgi:hypothetical protein